MPLKFDASNNLFVVGTITTVPPSNASTNLAQWAASTLGVPTNFGTTPGAVISGSVNASLFIGTTVAVAATAGVLLVGIEGRAGTSLETTAGILDTNLKNVNNAVVVTSAAGIQKVGISDSTGTTLTSLVKGTQAANAL